MKLTILSKVLILVITLSIVPVIIGSVISYSYFKKLEKVALTRLEEGTESATKATKDSLDALGRQIIKNRALAASMLVDEYLKENPSATIASLTKDDAFQKLGVLPVGEKGYTVIVTTDDSTFIAHPNKKLLNVSPYDMPTLQGGIFASFWEIVDEVTKHQKESEGYYRWREADESISEKYMYIALTKNKTRDGKRLAAAATTYVNEFNSPALTLQEKLANEHEETVKQIAELDKQILFARLSIVFILLATVITLSFFFSRKITNPIKEITDGAKAIATGNLSATLPEIKTGDEIEDLATSLEAMRKSITAQTGELLELKDSLEHKVTERTKELEEAHKLLEEKLVETEQINKAMIDRELKMVELKEELARLQKNGGEITQ